MMVLGKNYFPMLMISWFLYEIILMRNAQEEYYFWIVDDDSGCFAKEMAY